MGDSVEKNTDKNVRIIVTGAAGFIGSCLVGYLNQRGYENLILVDDFSRPDKVPNLEQKKFTEKIEREVFFEWLESSDPPVAFFFHIGAKTDTTEFDYSVHEHLNVDYSKKVWNWCTAKKVPLVYASSAANIMSGTYQLFSNQSAQQLLQGKFFFNLEMRCRTKFYSLDLMQVF